MAAFSEAFPDDVLMEALGDDIVYFAEGVGHPIKAIVEKDVENLGNESQMPERRTEIEFLKNAIPRYPRKSDEVDIGGYVLHVETVLSDDGTYVRLVMNK